jgi:hypothetical protein
MRIGRLILVTGTLAVALLAGCGDSKVTAPAGGEFDAAAAGEANATIAGLLGGSGMTSVAALGPRMPAGFGGAGAAAPAPVPGLAGLALRLLQSLPAAGGPISVQVIRPAVLGATYVYDPGTHRYIPDPARDGAPANGVRFILYAVDPGSHEPLVGQEIGYADLTDQGPPGLGVGLRFIAVASGRTFLDYAFTLTPAITGGVLGVSGFLADEQHRLEFTIGAVGQTIGASQAARVTFDLAVPSQRFRAIGSIDAVASGSVGTAHVEVAVTIGSNVIRLAGESSATAVQAGLTVNGRLFATITGDPLHPTVRGDGGRELTAAEIEALGGLVGVVYGAIEIFEHLLEPVAVLLGISISL